MGQKMNLSKEKRYLICTSTKAELAESKELSDVLDDSITHQGD